MPLCKRRGGEIGVAVRIENPATESQLATPTNYLGARRQLSTGSLLIFPALLFLYQGGGEGI